MSDQLLKVYPAYGRTYKPVGEARRDFMDGKDFSATPQGGPYMSIRDFFNGNLNGFDGVIIVVGKHLHIIYRDEMKEPA